MAEPLGRLHVHRPDHRHRHRRLRHPAGAGVRLELESPLFDETITLGESIAVDGACLTVVEHAEGCAAFELAPETLRKTNFERLRPGSVVNLERSLRLGDRLDGHSVQGHVDGVGSLLSRESDSDWEKFVFPSA